jgi:hypothetical protein
MVSLSLLHNSISRRLHLRTIALAQLLVMVLLAVPVCCYEVESGHEANSIGITAETNDVDRDKCPCCPEENKADSDTNSCSTCSYCTYYAPLTPVITSSYDPSITPLNTPEQFTKLTNVHPSIFVPPQNLS